MLLAEDLIEKAVEAAIDADVIPMEGEFAGSPGVRLIDYIDLNPAHAAELGVNLTLGKDGKPRWHGFSDIAIDEQRDYQAAILTPILRAALLAVLQVPNPLTPLVLDGDGE